MAITERDRRDIYTGLEQVLGENAANNLMQLLPFQPADELVTRSDMHAHGSGLRGEMAELRGELRGEMAELRSELTGEMAELRAELRGEMVQLRADVSSDLTREISRLESLIVDLKSSTTRAVVGGAVINAVAIVTAIGLG